MYLKKKFFRQVQYNDEHFMGCIETKESIDIIILIKKLLLYYILNNDLVLGIFSMLLQ